MSFPTEIWDLQIPLGNYRLSHCNCRDNYRNTLGDASPTTSLNWFISIRPPKFTSQQNPTPGHPPKFGFPIFDQQPLCTSQRKITAGGSLGYQPLGGSFGAINRGHRGIHPKQIRWKRIDVCMSLKTIGSMGNVPSSFWGVVGIMMVFVHQDFNESGIDFQIKPPAFSLLVGSRAWWEKATETNRSFMTSPWGSQDLRSKMEKKNTSWGSVFRKQFPKIITSCHWMTFFFTCQNPPKPHGRKLWGHGDRLFCPGNLHQRCYRSPCHGAGHRQTGGERVKHLGVRGQKRELSGDHLDSQFKFAWSSFSTPFSTLFKVWLIISRSCWANIPCYIVAFNDVMSVFAQIATCCQMSTECFGWVDGNSWKLEVSTGDAKLCLCDNENPAKGFRIFETSHNWTNAYSSEMLNNYTTANIQIPLHPNELSAFISIHAITRFLPREISSPSGLCMSLASWDISIKDCTVSTFIGFTNVTITVHKVVHVFMILYLILYIIE